MPLALLCALAAAAPASPRAGRELGPGDRFEARSEQGARRAFRVDAVEPDPLDGDGDLRLYRLSARSRSGSFTPYCPEDAKGRRLAVVIAGAFDRRGRFTPGGHVTIACLGGVAAKCVRWGYKPWKAVAGRSLLPYYQACTRMARADYCGDGRSHTQDGTWIDLWDRLGIQRREAEPGRPVVLEAGWGPDGATFVNLPRWSDDVRSIAASCPQRLAGRTPRPGEPAPSPEELERRFPETLLFNERSKDLADGLRPPAP